MYLGRVTSSSQIFPIERKSKEEKARIPAMDAIILAGGFGTRLRYVVPDLPKPMAPINERPFLEIQMEYWVGQGITRFILAVGYMKEVIQDHFHDRFQDIEVVYAEEHEPLGTGGAILNAAELIDRDRDFIVMNGDTFFEVSLADLYTVHATKEAEITIGLRELEINDRYSGVRLAPDSHILEFQARDARWPENTVNGGIYVINKRMLSDTFFPSQRPLSWEDDVLPDLLGRSKRIYGHVMNGKFIDIGIPEDYERAQELLAPS